jgi:hypothetical protein
MHRAIPTAGKQPAQDRITNDECVMIYCQTRDGHARAKENPALSARAYIRHVRRYRAPL